MQLGVATSGAGKLLLHLLLQGRSTGILRSGASKVRWVGKATTFCVGLAVILALVFRVATTALAGTGVGAVFNLGKTNTVNQLSRLVGSVSGAVIKVDNDGSGTALDLRVGSPTAAPGTKTTPPMQVDSQARVANLNADKVDGKDSSAFASKTPEGWHEIETPGEPYFGGVDGGVRPTTAAATTRPAFYKDPLGIVHLKGLVKWGGLRDDGPGCTAVNATTSTTTYIHPTARIPSRGRGDTSRASQ
jgi:hypothetical protein